MFLELLTNGVLVQTILSLLFGVTICALVLMGTIPPDWFLVISSSVIGFWFGNNGIATAKHIVKRATNGGGE